MTNEKKEVRVISWEELASHKDSSSSWICIDGKAYDVTRWAKVHPGGSHALDNISGRDASDLIRQFHVPSAWEKKIPNFYIGDMEPKAHRTAGKPAFAEDCRALRVALEEGGWYDPSFTYCLGMTLWALVLFVTAWFLTIYGAREKCVWTQFVGAFFCGMFWQQSNFLGHDAGHGSVVPNKCKLASTLYGVMVGNMFSGLSIAWWKHSHYTHHVVTNVISHDPDIQHLPALAISEKFFKGFHSFYWGIDVKFDAISQFMVSNQMYLYFPIMSVARVGLHVQSLLHVLTHKQVPNRLYELFGLLVFWTWFGSMLMFLPTGMSMFVFWYITHATVALIHVQICISHFIMETFDGVPYMEGDESYFEFQLRTTLDITCPEWLDWLHGGLQFQAIHHLFPRVPRHRLRELSYIVAKLCEKHGVEYRRHGFFEANMLTLEHMNKVGMAARNGRFVKFEDTLLFHGMNAVG